MRGLLEEPNDGIALLLSTTGSSGAATYNTTTGQLNIPIYSGGGSFGIVGQIPFTNAGGTDFDYDSDIIWDGTQLDINNSSTNVATLRVGTGGGTANAISLMTAGMGSLIGGIGLASNIASNAFQLSATNRPLVLHNNGVGGLYLNSSSQITIQGSSGVVINESGADDDFRVESNVDIDAFFLDGANSEVTIGGYGGGTITGTATYNLAVDSSGKIIEVATGGGGMSEAQALAFISLGVLV